MKDIKQLNQGLNFEFLKLDIKGTNIESYYSYRFELFLLETSELSRKEKFEAITTGKLNGKSKITINKVLSERTFIQDQIVQHEENLKEPINRDAREKLNIWVDYLKQKEKAISVIKQEVPEWTNPLVALYCIYSGTQINEKNREEITKQLKAKNSPDIVKQYNEYQKQQNRIFSKFEEELKRLKNLQLIMEDRDEKGSGAYEQLLSEIKTLKTNLGHEQKK
jgi:hypothetical protein